MGGMMKGKRGTHAGVIISFAVFITFIIFLLFIIQPAISLRGNNDAALDNTGILLLDYLSSDLNTISISIHDSVTLTGQSCLKINEIDPLDEIGVDGEHIYVKNSTGGNIDFSWFSAQNHLDVENRGQNRFFKIYSSQAINSSETDFQTGCQNIAKADYDVGIVRTESQIFEKNIIDAIALYNSDYDALRQDMGLSGNDFGFDFAYGNGTIISTGEMNQQTSVYTKDLPFYYLDDELNSEPGDIIMRVW
jgi:hypothetical protein